MTFTAPAELGVAELPTTGGVERRAPLGRTLGLVRPARRQLVCAVALGAGAVGAAIGLMATSAWLISRASQRPPESALALAIVGVQFFALSRGLLRYAERLVGHDAAFGVLGALRTRMYEQLERLAPMGLPAFRRGDLLARLVDDVDAVQDLLLRVVPPFAIAGVVGAAAVAVIWWMLPAAGAVLLVGLLLGATGVPWCTGRLARRSQEHQAAARGDLAATVVDLVEGAPELVANGATGAQLSRAINADRALTRCASASARTAGVGLGLTTLLTGLTVWAALVVGVPAVHHGTLSTDLLAVIVLTPLAAFELVVGLPAATQSLERVRRSSARVFDVLDTPVPVDDPATPRSIGAPPHTLRAEALRVRYPERSRWALDGVDLELEPGRRIAVVGPSGAGKSTLAGAIVRFVAYQGGRVCLDGVETTAYRSEDVRRVVGYLAQDAHVFDTTLEQNLRLARPDASTSQLEDALRAVRLLDWVGGLPDGLQTAVGERGTRMSGGQRQRLAFARAVLADFPIVILDEPTEHLDGPTAEAVMSDVLAMARPWSILLITHRLSGLESMDEILFLEGGRVLERGSHTELLAAGGCYAGLWRRERALRSAGTVAPLRTTAAPG